jgi:lysophospholipase L1-like esterase
VQLSSSAKHRLFGAILVLTPVAVLLLVEMALRIFSYGIDPDLVQKTVVRGREFYTINRMVARRYFSAPGIAIPEPPDVLLPVAKPAHTRRIFCLGESTMAGFPYEYNATPTSMLKDQLTALFPSDTIEVINVGLSAIGSTVVLDLIRDLTAYSPDLFVIYVGHNEYYGVFGAGSASVLAGSAVLTRLQLTLVRTRLYTLLQDAVARAGTMIHPGEGGTGSTLMEEMGNRSGIPLHGEVYERGLATFRRNLTGIIDEARSHNVPILVSTLVANLAEQPPFASSFATGTTTAQHNEIARLLDTARSAAARHTWPAALEASRAAVSRDSSYAMSRFLFGRALQAAGDTTGALREFRAARDLDEIRFRASEELQQTILAVCTEERTPVARVDVSFASASPGGISGHTLILEHLHPNIRGYAIMARTWAEAIRDHRLLAPSSASGTILSDSACMEAAAITSFDVAIGAIKTAQLTSHWPFTPDQKQDAALPGDTVRLIVSRALHEHTAWTRARYAVAEWYERRKEFPNARREYAAIAKALPYSFQPVVRQGDAFAAEGLTADAVACYEQSIRIEENPYAHMKLGVLKLQSGNAPGAATELERGFAVDTSQGGVMTTGEKAFGRSLLAYAYARTGRFDAAKEEARKALVLQPGMKEATELLRRLP